MKEVTRIGIATRPVAGRLITYLVPIGLAVVLPSCVTTGPGGKTSFILISEDQEVELGKSVDAEVRKQNKPLADSAWQAYLREVGEKIVTVCDRPNLDYQFLVIESDQVNAFATPGGYVYFYTGILDMMENEAELAAVMAHEISHVVGRHSVKHLQTALGAGVILQIALGNAAEGVAGQAASVAIGVGLSGYGRGHELEADRFGVGYMVEAGYNPQGARTMFEKLAQLSGGQDRGFFENLTASHPETQERIARIDGMIAAMPRTVDALPNFADRYTRMKQRLPEPVKDTTKTK